MFESKEEVDKAMADLKMFGGLPEDKDNQDHTEEEYKTQIFPEHEAMSDRFCRTLYYGKLPAGGDRPSLPFTQVAVDQFTESGLDALGQNLGRLSLSRAADMTRQASAGPNSLVVALLYLERLRKKNPEYLTSVSSADLFLVSLLVASKFLHDDGEEDEVFNDEWAKSGGMDTKELNKLEMQFLSAIDWRIYVDNKEYDTAVEKIESSIAVRALCDRGWSSYSDLSVLCGASSPYLGSSLLSLLLRSSLQMTCVCLTAYAASFLTMLSTVALLSRTPLGPQAVTTSISTLMSSTTSTSAPEPITVPDYPDIQEMETIQGLVPENTLETENESVLYKPGLSPAELLKASLFVTTLASSLGSEDKENRSRKSKGRPYSQPEDDINHGDHNQTRAEWLSEYSRQEESYGWDRLATLDRPEFWLKEKSQFIHHSTDSYSFYNHIDREPKEDPLPGLSEWKNYINLTKLLGKCPIFRFEYSSKWAHGLHIMQNGLNMIKV